MDKQSLVRDSVDFRCLRFASHATRLPHPKIRERAKMASDPGRRTASIGGTFYVVLIIFGLLIVIGVIV
jgi:hypothetical protein